MSCVIALTLTLSLVSVSDATFLRSKEPMFLQTDKTQGEDPIPDPTCKRGVASPDLKICCTGECGSCGTHPLCNDVGKFHEVTGKLADNCCRGRILKKAKSCDKDHAPCVLSASYKEKLNTYVEERPKRHAGDDCTKAVPAARARHATAIERGEQFSTLYNKVRTKYAQAKSIAEKVGKLCTEKTDESEALIKEYSGKIDSAAPADKVKDPLSGSSKVQRWGDQRENEKAEIKFYGMIISNGKEVGGEAAKGLVKVKSLKEEIQKARDVSKYRVKINALVIDADKVFDDANSLWKQWLDSSKDYGCGAAPNVSNAGSQCETGNTKFTPKCHVICKLGYDGNGTRNSLRCTRQGKFGKELYGEWTGMAACVGRMCGKPPKISAAKTVIKDIRFPHDARYTCHEGHSIDGTPTGAKAFNVPCSATGNFDQNTSHACKPISCGAAPAIKNAKPIPGKFVYTEMATYECLPGFTTDETPGGLKNFSISCQASGKFSAGPKCKPVRCGPPADYDHTVVKTGSGACDAVCKAAKAAAAAAKAAAEAAAKAAEGAGSLSLSAVRSGIGSGSVSKPSSGSNSGKPDQYYGDKLDYVCKPGYTLDQKAGGADHYTLVCHLDGEFAVDGTDGNAPLPKCRPISAGMAPKITHGNLNPREMFYGESAVVTADSGYSTSGNPGEGIAIELAVTTKGTYSGSEETFIPVVCGPPPQVQHAKTTFAKAKASYGDLLAYSCKDGYSTDKTDASASSSFSIQCEADGSFSKVPGLGMCANIDDCDGVTCGAHGECVDHLKNYTCKCESGFDQRWDEKTKQLTCGNTNDCGPEACGVGKCEDLVNDYKCTCPEGYEQIDETNAGKTDHTCKAVTCGTPPVVTNGATTPVEKQSEKAYYPAQVMYQCDLGHTTDATATGSNHFSIDCQASKSFTDAKECKPIKCDAKDLPVVPESSIKGEKSATFNESVRFDCDEGHTVDGTIKGDKGFTVTCQVTGKFGPPQQCKPVTCGEPDEVPNAFRESGSLHYGESIQYECFNGFTLDGTKEGETTFGIDCEASGQLTKVKQCLPKICGEPPLEIDALYASTKDEGLVRYPRNTEVICRDGYTVGGDPTGNTTFTVACLASGAFERYDERSCAPVRCGVPPPMPNATLSEIKSPSPAKPGLTMDVFWFAQGSHVPDLLRKKPSDTQVVDTINYPGKGGSKWPGMGEMAGMLSFAARRGAMDNVAVRFSGQLDIESGGAPGYSFQLESDDGSILYLDGMKVVDNDGLHGMQKKEGTVSKLFKGPHALKVEYFNQLGGAGLVLKYQGADTAGGWALIPSTATQTKGGNLNYEEKAVYKCLPGFTTGGEVDAPTSYNVECLPSGQLSAPAEDMQCRNVNDCEKHSCGPKGTCVDLVGPSPAYTCQCEHGYEIQTNADGEKHCGNKDDCAGKDCGIGICVDRIGDYTCECPSGFFVGVDDLDGSKTCVPVQCWPETPSLEHGQLLSSHNGAVNFPATLRYKCDTGYSIDGTVAESQRKFQAQCKADGQLWGMMSCQKVSCGTPHIIPFTYLTTPSSPMKSLDYDEKAQYKCFDGYTVGGKVDAKTTFEVSCQDTGVLTDPEVCEPVKCGIAPHVPKSRPAIAGNVFFGQALQYACDMGYTLDGTIFGATQFPRTCLKDGSFSALASEQPCKPLSAGTAPLIKNALMAEYDGKEVELELDGSQRRPEVFYPKGLEYRCNVGYSSDGSPSGPTKITARVNSIGTFTPALPAECQPITFVIRGRVKNARSGSSLSGVKVSIEGTDISATSSWGFFTLRDVKPGTVKLLYEKSGMIKTERSLEVTGDVYSGGEADINMSPSMADDQWRAVLKWDRRPSDLDTYGKWGWSKVYWAGRRARGSGMTGVLEQDRTSGYGPETLYLSGVGDCWGDWDQCDIKYSINDYGETGSMAQISKAEVTLYTGSRVAGTWKIGDCTDSVSSDGNWWHVFTLDGASNKLKWTCTTGDISGASSDDFPEGGDDFPEGDGDGDLMMLHHHKNKSVVGNFSMPISNVTEKVTAVDSELRLRGQAK